MKGFLKISLLALVLMLAASCVHYWPEDPAVDPTLVKLTLRLHPADAMTLYDNGNSLVETRDYYTKSTGKVRYYLRIYADESFNSDLIYEEEIIADESSLGEIIERELDLHALHYRVVVWQDMSDMYNVTDLNAICIADSRIYVASKDEKLAQSVSSPMDLSAYSKEWDVTTTYDIKLVHPVAKFVLVASDVEKFTKAYYANYPSKDGTDIGTILSDCTVRISYNGYVPTGYNAISDKLNDSQPGYSFDTTIKHMGGNEAVIGFDYILVGQETSVNVKIEIFDADGSLINTADNISIPLERNKITVVRGEYLTRDYGGGIGIDPGFDGEYNIHV